MHAGQVAAYDTDGDAGQVHRQPPATGFLAVAVEEMVASREEHACHGADEACNTPSPNLAIIYL